jgi:serine/threonine protein kinase/WD40 repeat protein/Flp pilus assembly protein TadD
MSADKPDIQAIFNQAIALESGEKRVQHLDLACGDDFQMRARVEALLHAHSEAGGFLGGKLSGTAATEAHFVAETPGTHIGPYKLLQQIGEGGMGVVYMAEQLEPVRRRVALKIIKPGMDTRQVIARFEAERQALSLMDHPNIARVLDAGTTDSGRPYFVMELVKGQLITQYCDEHHLTPRQRVELLLPVCQAIQHAHQKGIIHRDIKPTNILVAEYDDQPVPKVIDFGVAKAISQSLTEKTLFTGMGQIVGTLEYMSPEQAKVNQLDIDTRSDIYSLGVLLYELLTGSTPLDKQRLRSAGWDEMLRIIREEEPPKPSTKLSSGDALPSVAANRSMEPDRLSRTVRGELDWIVMKALEKDRNRRYETANGFAMDLQRYLHDEQVQACPPSTIYRLRKFARRNKAALATSAIVLSALLIGIATSTWQAIRATKAEGLAHARLQAEERARREAETARDGEAKQRKLAQQNAAEAEGQRQRAEANFGKARQAVDEYLTQITENELLSVPGLQPLREDLLQAALKFYAEFTQEVSDDPTLQRELASAHYRVGTIQRDLGNAEASQKANLEAIRLYEQLRDQGQVSVELQAALAAAYFFAGRFNDTVKLCQIAMQREPEHGAVRSLLADTYNDLAVAEGNKKNATAALKYHQQAFELREALVRDFPDDPRYLAQLGGTLNNLGFVLNGHAKREEALAMFERSVEYSAQAYERAPHSILWGRWLCNGLLNVASSQAALDRQEAAQRSYERLVGVSRKRAFENPALGSLRADLYRAHLHLGKHHQRLANAADASRCFRLAREVLEQTPRETADQLFELAMVYAILASPLAESLESSEEAAGERKRNADLAMETLKKAVEAGFQNASVLGTYPDLNSLRDRDDFQALLATVQKVAEADRLAKAEDKDAAKKLSSRQQAVSVLKGLAGDQPGHLRHRATLASALQSIGVIQTGLKQFEEAEKSLSEALKLREELFKEQSQKPQARVDVLSVRDAIGQLDWNRDRPQDAHRLWQEILNECQKLAAEHAKDARLQAGIVGIERSIGNQYGDIGLLEATLQSVDRGLQTGQLFDSAGDFHDAHVLAALGRLEEHRKLGQLITGKWSKTFPAQTIWATTMNPQPVLEEKQLVELAERVIKSDLDSLWKFKAATAWYRTGEYSRALELMLPARDKVTTSGGSAGLYWYALVYHKLGKSEDATRFFEQAEAKYLKSADKCLQASKKSAVKDTYGGAWWTWAEDQAARRAAWMELRGADSLQDPWQHLIQARGFQLIGEQEKSVAELAAADAKTPNDLANWRARLRLATRFEDAERIWQHIVELAGDDPLLWIERGRWYSERGEHQKADADFIKAATLTPDNLNKFIEAGWWAAKTPGVLLPLAPHQVASAPAPKEEPTAPAPPTVVLAPPAGRFEFRHLPELKDASTGYAMTFVYAQEAKSVMLLIGGEEPVELRVNGRPVYEWKARSSNYTTDRVPVLLRPGRNTFVARVSNPGRVNSLLLRFGDSRLDRGLELARLGFWDEALTLLKPELAQGERLGAQAWNFYSALLLATGDVTGYREFYRQVWKWVGDTPHWDTSLHASQVCTRAPTPEADIERLVQLVDEAVAKTTAKGWPEQFQLDVYFRAGRYQEVLDRIGTGGTRRSALRALCWHHLGEANKAKSDLQRAEREFGEMVKMGPEGPSSAPVSGLRNGLLEIAHLYVLLREARALIAPTRPPDDQALHALIARTRQQIEAADPRLLPFEKALIAGGKKPQAWLERGRARAQLGQWELAQADFAKAIALAPNDPEVLAARCLIYAELNRAHEAMADLDSVLNEDADNAKSPGWVAARQRLFDNLAQFPELFEHVARHRPADPSPWFGRARYHVSRIPWSDEVEGAGSAEKAVTDLREAVARGFRDFDQPKTDTNWQTLAAREDFKQLVRETAERYADDLILLAKLDAHTDVVRCVAFLPDGQRLVSVGRDKSVRVWDLQNYTQISSFAIDGYPRDADVSGDGRLVAVVSNSREGRGMAQVWDLEKQELVGELAQDFTSTNGVRWSADATRILTTGNPSSGVLWELSSKAEVRRFEITGTSYFDSGEISRAGGRLALGHTGLVKLFEVDSGNVLASVRLPKNRFIKDLAFALDGKVLASAQAGGHITILDAQTGHVIKELQVSNTDVLGVRFSPNRRFLCASNLSGTLQIWDIESNQVIAAVKTQPGTNDRLALSRDGRFAITASGEEWDEESKKWKANGDYALRLWRLPRSVWNEPSRPATGKAAEKPELN